VPDVDLNCRENVLLNSDSDEHSDDETIMNKVFPQQRFSPVVTCPARPAALRPRPIKVRARSVAEVTLVTGAGASVVRPSNVSSVAFQPRGDVFKARPAQSLSSAGNYCGRLHFLT